MVLLCAILLGISFTLLFQLSDGSQKSELMTRSCLGDLMSENLLKGKLPPQIQLVYPELSTDVTQADIHYTLNMESQKYIGDLIKQYKPDLASFVALDAQTGRILSLVSYHRDAEDEVYGNLSFRAIFPAASIFKVVTATAAIDLEKLSPESLIAFNGGSHTLYRRNVTETKYNRWTRSMSLREAFGKSVNTVFGKVGAYHVGPESLFEYAERFKFNKQINSELPIEIGPALRPVTDNAFEIAEAASGFNKENQMSPIQGALIASAVANDGVMMLPYLIEQLTEAQTGKLLYQHQAASSSVTMKPETAEQLRDLMTETVEAGTSKKSFRQVFGRKPRSGEIEYGGKTGSLTGNKPKGKVDWFVGYARGSDEKIAISVMTLHKKYWTVKSSYLGAAFFEHYFKQKKIQENLRHQNLREPASSNQESPVMTPLNEKPKNQSQIRPLKKKRTPSASIQKRKKKNSQRSRS
jgi:peptidoglycan glycosyltransferase